MIFTRQFFSILVHISAKSLFPALIKNAETKNVEVIQLICTRVHFCFKKIVYFVHLFFIEIQKQRRIESTALISTLNLFAAVLMISPNNKWH